MALGTRRHSLLTGADIGSLVRWTVADETARLALTLTSVDGGRLAHQLDADSYHILADVSTPTWVQLGNVTTVTTSGTAPTVGDDELDGHSVGDFWIHTDTVPSAFVLIDATAGAAVWLPIGTAVVTSVFGRIGDVVATSGDYDATQVDIAALGAADHDTVQAVIDTALGVGVNHGGLVTDNGDGTVAVSTGSGFIRATDSDESRVYATDWPAVASLALTDNAINYVFVEYNAGTPEVAVSLTLPTDLNTNLLLSGISRAGTFLHPTPYRYIESNLAREVNRRLYNVDGTTHASGAAPSETGTLNFAFTEGEFYLGLNRGTFTAEDTSVASTFLDFYRDGVGGWTLSGGNTAIDALQYDDGSGALATLSTNRYGVHWVYISPWDQDIYVIYGRGNYTGTQAQTATPPGDLPEQIDGWHGILAAKIVVRKSATTFTSIESAFVKLFLSEGVTDHGDLAGLGDDDHPHYLLADGTRALTGPLATSSTIDGRDLSVDGTKLDTIETSATADQTGAEIKALYEVEPNAYTDTKNTKLAGIETAATADQTGAEIKVAYEAELDTNAYTDAEKTKLGTIEDSATADQTGAEIKVAYEGEADTNAYTDAEKAKLGGIEALADVTDTANVTAAGALMDSEVDADLKTFALPASTTISAFGATLVDDATAALARTTLGAASQAEATLNSDHRTTVTGNPHAVTKSEVGLGSADDTSDADKPVSTAQQTALDLKEDAANKGIAGGYASLDGSGLLPSSQLPVSALEFKGGYNATPNSPSLALPYAGASGDTYSVTTAGTQDLGGADGSTDYAKNDRLLYDGSDWVHEENTDEVGGAGDAHAAGDGSDHADVAANTAANALDLTHRGTVTGNPHAVTKAEVGLGNADDTSDAAKPISTATQTALDLKGEAAAVGLNTTHRTSAGTDHADVVTNTARAALSGSGDPGVSTGNGKLVGHVYIDTTGDKAWTLVDATTDANVWTLAGGITDHGALGGLADDDHTRYVDKDGTRQQDAAFFAERAANVNTPIAGSCELWAQAAIVASPIWTDDLDIDWYVLRSQSPTNYAIPTWNVSGTGYYMNTNTDFLYISGELSLSNATAAVRMKERATGPTSTAGEGKDWVLNNAPSDRMHTDDTGAMQNLSEASRLSGSDAAHAMARVYEVNNGPITSYSASDTNMNIGWDRNAKRYYMSWYDVSLGDIFASTSTDGKTWNAKTNVRTTGTVGAQGGWAASDEEVLFVNGTNVYRSTNLSTLSFSTHTFNSIATCTGIIFDAIHGKFIACGYSAGTVPKLEYSTNGGVTWYVYSTYPLSGDYPVDIAHDHTRGYTAVVCGTYDQKFYFTTNSTTWSYHTPTELGTDELERIFYCEHLDCWMGLDDNATPNLWMNERGSSYTGTFYNKQDCHWLIAGDECAFQSNLAAVTANQVWYSIHESGKTTTEWCRNHCSYTYGGTGPHASMDGFLTTGPKMTITPGGGAICYPKYGTGDMMYYRWAPLENYL